MAAEEEGCDWWEATCHLGEGLSAVMENTLTDIVNSVLEAVGNAVVAVGTIWVRIPTPDLTGGGSGSSPAQGWQAPDGSAQLESVLAIAMWVSLGVCVLSVMALGVRFAQVRAGDGAEQMGRFGMVLGAVVLVSSATSIVAALMPTPGERPGPAASAPVAMIQDSLWWYTAAAAVLSIIVGGARMAWEQRAQPGKDVLRSLLTLVLVSGAGLSVVASLVVAADAFSGWILNQATACDVTDPSTGCFAKNVGLLFMPLQATGLGQLLVILMGLAAVLMTLLQIVLMLARSAMLVLLTGILPLSAAATNTETGKQWFRKNVAWLAGFILYKPAAAIVYAAAIKLMASDWVTGDNPIIAMAAGMTLMGIALIAMPALMRFVTPLAAVTAGGAGGAALAGAAMALPTGAVQLAQRGASQSGPQGAGGSSGSGSSGPSGSGGSPGGPGSSGGSGSAGASGSGSGGGKGRSGPKGAPAGAGSGAAPGGGSAGGGGAAAASGGGASGAAAGGGGAAAGGAAAAAGPAGMAAAAAMQAGQKVKDTATAVAHEAATQTGDRGGPSGSH